MALEILNKIIEQVYNEEQFLKDAQAWDEKCAEFDPVEEAARWEQQICPN